MAIGTGDRAPEFDLEETYQHTVRLEDYLGRRNLLLVFHPFAFTAVCAEEAMDLEENLESFDNAETDILFVSCDPSAARQAWKRELGADVHLRQRLLGPRRHREGVRGLQRGDRGACARARS